MASQKKILIVGGGIAGLTAASLLQKNHTGEVHLIERQDAWQASGTGLYTPGNGVAALEALALDHDAKAKGNVIHHREIFDSQGNLLMKLDLAEVWDRPDPCLNIGRKALHEILVKQVKQDQFRLKTSIQAIQQQEEGVEVIFSDESKGKYDLVIGADGLYSQTRKLVLGDCQLNPISNQVCRFTTAMPKGITAWTLFVSSKGQFLIIPMNKDRAYCYVNRKSKKDVPNAQFMQDFVNFPAPVPEIIQTWKPDDAYWDDVEELEPLSVFGKNRVVLIGDAAHGMPPFMAQGGSLALEDALVLANLLQNEEDWSQLAERFTDLRKERIDWVYARNRKRGKLAKLPFWIARLGLQKVGAKNWTTDYAPLRESPDFG
jgi:2-polyprenyl-6-methoxyphenol hydroxylase-like FAD-dependent oxidoreductase